MPGIHAPDGDRSKILGHESDMPLFVVLRGGLAPGGAMTHNMRALPPLMESEAERLYNFDLSVFFTRTGIHFARRRYSRAIEANESRRFLPHEIFAVPEKSARIVRQKQAFRSRRCYPVSRSKKSSNVDAIANPACLDWWVAFAGKFRQS
jgi:hypothetical protein